MCQSRFAAVLLTLCFIVCAAAPPAAGQPAPGPTDSEKLAKLSAEVEKLRAEVETLKAENAALREKLAAAEEAGAKKAGAETPGGAAVKFELGPEATLGAYTYKAPLDWIAAAVKNNANAAVYRSADKAAVILVNLKNKGAIAPEIAPQYAQKIITQLKQDFAKNKTEVIDPPAAQPDPRFFLKIHERIRIKEKTADQTHVYLMPNKDLVELTVITTAEAPETIAATAKLAEDVLLSFKAGK